MWHVLETGEVHTGLFWCGDLRERGCFEDPGVDGSLILKTGLQEMGQGARKWNELAQDRDRWRSVVNAVMNIRVP